MATSPSKPENPCMYLGSNTLDPDGDVILVFNSRDAVISDPHEVNLVHARTQNSTDDEDYETTSDTEDDEEQNLAQSADLSGVADIEVRVSSKHLMLGSPVFKALLSQNFSEGKTLHEIGTVKIPLDEDPIDGMMVLLRLLHFDFRQPKMTPSLLMQVALLADKYDMATQILYWSRLWCDSIAAYIPLPNTENLKIVLYMGLFSMLKIQDRKMTMMDRARICLTDHIFEHGLPIQHLINTLYEERLTVLECAFGSIDEIINRYSSAEHDMTICKNKKYTCDATILGLLLKGLKQKGLWPLPDKPFKGLSIDALIVHLKGIAFTSECHRKDAPSKESQHKPLFGSSVNKEEPQSQSQTPPVSVGLFGSQPSAASTRTEASQSQTSRPNLFAPQSTSLFGTREIPQRPLFSANSSVFGRSQEPSRESSTPSLFTQSRTPLQAEASPGAPSVSSPFTGSGLFGATKIPSCGVSGHSPFCGCDLKLARCDCEGFNDIIRNLQIAAKL